MVMEQFVRAVCWKYAISWNVFNWKKFLAISTWTR